MGKEWPMAGSREDATLIVELAKWGSMIGLDEASRLIWSEDFDPDAAEATDRPIQAQLMFYETIGTLVRNELLDRDLVYDWLWVEGVTNEQLVPHERPDRLRSEEHTSELQSP